MTSNVDTLTKYGKSFQSKIIISLLTNKEFLDQIFDLLTGDFFDSDADKEILRIIEEYYAKYKIYPSLEVFKVSIGKLHNDVLKVSVKDRLREIYSHSKATDLAFVQTEFLEFCKNQKIKTAIIDAVDLLKRGDYDRIKETFDSALRAGEPRNIGHDYIEEVNLRMTHVIRDTIPTGWKVVDDIMEGGLGPGELGIIVAPAGIGKSWALSHIGAHAVEIGKTVVHYTLELNENYTGRRYDTVFTNIAASELKANLDIVVQRVEGLDGELFIKYYPTKSVTVNTLAANLERITAIKGKPDLIIVDYADILRSVNRHGDVRHLELGGIYEELRGLAGELQVPIWTASQANRNSLDQEVIQAQSVAESYNKVMTGDFIISLSRHMADKVADTGRWHVIKNRFGPDGLTFPSKIQTAIGKIEIFDGNSAQGVIAQKQSSNGSNMVRDLLKKRHDEMKQDLG